MYTNGTLSKLVDGVFMCELSHYYRISLLVDGTSSQHYISKKVT
jgi:hypothetical protein